MKFPEKSKDAAKLVKKAAKDAGMPFINYCISKSVHPSVVYNWAARSGSYDQNLLEKLLSQS